MTPSILLASKEAQDLVKIGYAPDDAADLALSAAQGGKFHWNPSERRHVRDVAWAQSTKGPSK